MITGFTIKDSTCNISCAHLLCLNKCVLTELKDEKKHPSVELGGETT